MTSLARQILAGLWWGQLKQPVRMLVHRLPLNETILAGPLKGFKFKGTRSQLLGIYEMPIEQVIVQHLKLGAVFYDVGANYGYFTLLAHALVGSKGTVFAFEPVPDNISRIQDNLALNAAQNCKLISKAVAHESGQANLSIHDGVTSSLVDATEQNLVVETVSLDNFIVDNPLPTLIKIDVEGAEEMVLKGAQTLLARNGAPTLIIELHSKEQAEAVKQILAKFNYKLEKLATKLTNKRDYPYHIIAIKAKPNPSQ